MKKAKGYLIKKLEDEYLILPVGEKTEEVHEIISLSETAGFIYQQTEKAETVEQLAEIVAEEYGLSVSDVLEDVKQAVKSLQEKGVLL